LTNSWEPKTSKNFTFLYFSTNFIATKQGIGKPKKWNQKPTHQIKPKAKQIKQRKHIKNHWSNKWPKREPTILIPPNQKPSSNPTTNSSTRKRFLTNLNKSKNEEQGDYERGIGILDDEI